MCPISFDDVQGETGYDATNDPRSDDYGINADPDRDLINITEYDALGRVIRTQQLLDNRPSAVLETTLYGYDAVGRQIKVIRSASDADYDIAADPDLSGYTPSSDADQDILTQTVYAASGRVESTQDTMGVQTRLVYDGLGRQVRTIANYVSNGEDPALWVWDASDSRWEESDGTAIDHGTDNDQNILTETVYDDDGRVQETRDGIGRVSRPVYDDVGRQVRTIANYVSNGEDPALWVWDASDSRWEESDGTAIDHGTDNDQNILTETVYDAQGRVEKTFDHRHNETRYEYDTLGRRIKVIANYQDGTFSAGTPDEDVITTTVYDAAGRVTRTVDNAGIETRYTYDALGRRTQAIINYVDGVFSDSTPDEDLISTTVYNKGGQVIATTDARDTKTAFTYDAAGRRLTVTQVADSPLAATSYTCYDKTGRVLRSIQNWTDDVNADSPDAQDGNGDWLFVPPHNGHYNDRDLVTAYAYDQAGRRISVTDAVGNVNQTTYFKDGQVKSLTDPEGMVTSYRYDDLRRRFRVVQGFTDNGEDPALWVWDASDSRWEESDGTAIDHSTDNDQNIIVDVEYDLAGRVMKQRDPRGNLTEYSYDQRGRRTSLTNPLSKTWGTAYADLDTGGTRTTLTYPGVNGGSAYTVQRDFDRVGRLASIAYGNPGTTPDVAFTYDAAGSRAKMTEYGSAGFTNPVRKTTYAYDDVRRLTSVGFDTDGDSTVDETVSYEYDAAGLRTKLTLPGSLDITYTYNARGQLVSLTDWDSQQAQFAYDLAGRHIATHRPNGMRSRYQYDPAGRLRLLRHDAGFRTLAHFAYQVDGRGNRVQALELLPHANPTGDTSLAYNDQSLVLNGTWSDVTGFKESSQFGARLALMFFGDQATLTMGTGPDHSLYDIYIGRTLWQSFDGYAASAGQEEILIELDGDGPHHLEIRNRSDRNLSSSGYKVRFKQIVMPGVAYDLHTIEYQYDALARLQVARYNPGVNIGAADANLLRRYQFIYDRAGNRTQQSVALNGGTPAVTNYTYNAANQMTGDGTNAFGYDHNGNLTTVNSFANAAFDRTNRLVSVFDGVNTTLYGYDGLGNRVQQSVGAAVTEYLLDVQPGLAVVLSGTQGANVTRYIHSLRGVHAQQDNAGGWNWMVPDGLGSLRGVADDAVTTLESRSYAPYGEPFGLTGANQTPYGFTGEHTDPTTELLYLRARYYAPGLGVFPSLDPFEGTAGRPMSLNGYSWVEGNVPNWTDASGAVPGDIGIWLDRNRFSCKCGWLDAEHISLNVPAAMDEIVQQFIDWSSFIRAGKVYDARARFRAVYFDGIIGLAGIVGNLGAVTLGSRNAVIDEHHPDYVLRPQSIALGIWMEAQEEFERQQGQNLFPPTISSSFSIEDLVSDLVGYAAHRYDRNWARDTGDYSQKWQVGGWIHQECDVLDQNASMIMLMRYVAEYGSPTGFPKNYGWTPLAAPEGSNRPIPESPSQNVCPSSRIDALFRFTRPYQLLTTAVRSTPQGSGAWWWDSAPKNSPNRIQVFPDNMSVSGMNTIGEHFGVVQKNLYVALPFSVYTGC